MSEERKVIAVSKLPKYLCDTDKTASRKIHNSMHTACARKSNACSNNCLYAARGLGGHSQVERLANQPSNDHHEGDDKQSDLGRRAECHTKCKVHLAFPSDRHGS